MGAGVSLFYGPNFWTGVALFYLGFLFLTFHVARQAFVKRLHPRIKRCLRIVFTLGLIFFTVILLRPASIEIQATSNVPLYGPDSDINGIHWKKEYSELRLIIRNTSAIDYDNLDIAITTDLTFANLRQASGLASCAIAPEGEPFTTTSQRLVGGAPVGPADTSGEHEAVVAVDQDGRVISISGGVNQTYRIRCEKFPAHNANIFTGALTVVNPFSRGIPPKELYAAPKAATQLSAKINFTTSGRPRAGEISNCKMGLTCRS